MMPSSDVESTPSVTTLTLGRAADDQDDALLFNNSSSPMGLEQPLQGKNAGKNKGRWFSSLLFASSSTRTSPNKNTENKKQEENEPTEKAYNALTDLNEGRGDIGRQIPPTTTRRNHPPPPNNLTLEDNVNNNTNLLYNSLNEDDTHDDDDVLAQHPPDFFFRPSDTSPRRRPNQPFKELRRNSRRSNLFEYRDAVAVCNSKVLHQFRARYTQLNAAFDDDNAPRHHNTDDRHDWGHDLELQQDDATTTTTNTHSVLPNRSNLVYEADGRMLMKLPRDSLVLVMDPDLQAGVLSVAQTRNAESGDHTTAQQQQPLQYVLTVDDTLYRKLVDEMSPRHSCCCHCREDTKVDIRVAFGIFGAILLLLFVIMLTFKEE